MSNLTLNGTRKRRTIKAQFSTRKETMRVRVVINKTETKKSIEKIYETKRWLLEKIKKKKDKP